MKLHTLDLIIFLSYMTGMVLLGASFIFKNKTASQFTTGGGKIPTWAVGMSIFATFVSSISFLAIPAKAYQSDWNAFVFSLSIPFAAFMALKFFIPLYRSINSPSAYTYLEQRFGPWARIYASTCYILTQLMRTGSILYLLALPFHAILGWSVPTIIIVTGLIIVLYSMLGGIQAVIWTDAIQGIILIGGALVCALILMFSMPEGPSQFFDIAIRDNKFDLGRWDFSLTESTFWTMLIYGLFINVQNYGIDQNYVQRYLTAKSDKAAKSSALFGALLYIPVSFIFFFIGTALYTYYQTHASLLPSELSDVSQADKVFPFFMVTGLPVGVTGLLIASVFAAGMSTVSTSVNSTATIILTDYYKKYINTNPSEKKSMMVLYSSSTVFGILGILVGLAMMSVESALDAWWKLASIFSGGMLGLFLLGYFSKSAKNIDAAIGVAVGVLVILWMSLSPVYFNDQFLPQFKSNIHINLTIVIGTMVIFLVGFLLAKTIHSKRIKA